MARKFNETKTSSWLAVDEAAIAMDHQLMIQEHARLWEETVRQSWRYFEVEPYFRLADSNEIQNPESDAKLD
jgi:hypothetical protein